MHSTHNNTERGGKSAHDKGRHDRRRSGAVEFAGNICGSMEIEGCCGSRRGAPRGLRAAARRILVKGAEEGDRLGLGAGHGVGGT